MATVTEICERSLRLLGVRDFTDSDRQNEAMEALSQLLTSMRNEMHFTDTVDSLSITAGTSSYTIGTGATWDTARPVRVLSAYIRDSNGNDHVVDIISRKNYEEIYDKDASERPTKLYYDRANSSGVGTIYFNSSPSESETLYLTSFKPYSEYSSLSATFLLPVEYEAMVVYNLAVVLAPEYFMEAPQTVIALAAQYAEDIRNENIVPGVTVSIPTELRR